MALDELPFKKNRQKIEVKTERVVFLRDGKPRIFDSRKRKTSNWAVAMCLKSRFETAEKMTEIFRMKYGITKYRVDLQIFRGSDLEIANIIGDGQWVSVPEESDACAMAAPYRKALTRLVDNEFTEPDWELKA